MIGFIIHFRLFLHNAFFLDERNFERAFPLLLQEQAIVSLHGQNRVNSILFLFVCFFLSLLCLCSLFGLWLFLQLLKVVLGVDLQHLNWSTLPRLANGLHINDFWEVLLHTVEQVVDIG